MAFYGIQNSQLQISLISLLYDVVYIYISILICVCIMFLKAKNKKA